ncbi:MAG: alpha-E domain-containing protein [Gemmataceae bacterium]
MISRVAEHCFWLGRYLERAEDTARVLDVNQTLLLDYHLPLDQQWRPVLIISGIYDMPGEPDPEAVQHYMTWETANPFSIASSLAAARENARIIREVISAEMWERLNYYYLWLQGPFARQLYDTSRSEFYSQIRRINQLIHGIADGTMAHGEAWEFFQLGTYLERSCQTARILDVKYHIALPTLDLVGTPVDNAQWVAILTSCSGYEPFHKKVRQTMDTGVAVADFLLLDPDFPRSISFCLHHCQLAAHAISNRPVGESGNEVERALAELINWLTGQAIGDIIREGLHESLTRVVDTTHEIGEVIHRTYFDVRGQAPLPNPRERSDAPARATLSSTAGDH